MHLVSKFPLRNCYSERQDCSGFLDTEGSVVSGFLGRVTVQCMRSAGLDSDPYANKMERLRYAVVSGPGSLAPNIRQAISEGAYGSSPLGAFAQKVAEHAFMVNDEDIQGLHRAHYSDDQIFEAAVCAALGAGLYRLERVLTLIRTN